MKKVNVNESCLQKMPIFRLEKPDQAGQTAASKKAMWILSFSGQNDRVKRQAKKIITTERFQDNVASILERWCCRSWLSSPSSEHVTGQKVALYLNDVEILIFEVESDNEGVNPIEHQSKPI